MAEGTGSRPLVAMIRARRRLFVALAVGLAVRPLMPDSLVREARLALAWDAAAITYLGLVLFMAVRSHAETMRRRAAEEDSSVAVSLTIAVLAAGLSILAITTLLVSASGLPEPTRTLHLVLGATTTFLSWLFVHALFAVHAAHLYYAPRDGAPGEIRGGLDIPGEPEPDYFDFLYFSLVIGMTAQTADVNITGREMRRTALLHGMVSFVFNTLVLAFAVNIAAGLL